MEKRYEIIDKIIEIEIYLYIIFMFITKGESIRSLLLFSSFFLWLATLKYRDTKWIFKEPVPLLFWGFMAATIISVIFSIDPVYSLKSLRGEPLKSVILFCLISTTLSSEMRLKRLVYLSFFILVFTISVGYYSYFFYDLPLMKPVTTIRHAWHTQFAIDLNTLIPFVFIILLRTKDIKWKIVLFVTIFTGISGVILSTSRGGLAGLLSMAFVWFIFFYKVGNIKLKAVVSCVALFIILFGASLHLSPMIKGKFIDNKDNIMSFGRRTEIWRPLLAAASQRPFFGWGYGPRIFKLDEPFEKTPFKVAPLVHDQAFRNPHNPFLRVFFHQGIVGLIFYFLLSIVSTMTLWKGASDAENFKRYFLIACTGILIGTYFINAIVENSELPDLSFIISLGLAARYMKSENSHN